MDLIERVEIIRGPSSSLYGAEAFLAVINVITRKPAATEGCGTLVCASQFWDLPGTGQLWRPIQRDRHAALRHVLQQPGTDSVFSRSSTAQPPITGLPETRTTKALSTSWPRSVFVDSHCKDCSVRATRECLRHTSAPCSMTLAPATSTTTNTSISVTSIPLAKSGN